MPSPKRWHPVSRDLNDDPEMWELTEMFGDRALRIPLEVFGILDRTENEWRLTGHWLTGLSRKVRQQPSTVQRVVAWMLAKRWLVADQHTENGSPTILRALNYWKYHRRREPNGNQEDASVDPSLPNLPDPNLTETNIHKLGKRSEGRRGDARGEEGNTHTNASGCKQTGSEEKPPGNVVTRGNKRNGREGDSEMTGIDTIISTLPIANHSVPSVKEDNGTGRAMPAAVIELWNARPNLKHIPKNLRTAASLLDPLQQRCLTHPDLKLWTRLFDAPTLFTNPGHAKPIELQELVQRETFHMLVAALEESSHVGQ